MNEVFYLGFIVDNDLSMNSKVIVEAGVDLLAGPFPTQEVASRALRTTCEQHSRLAAFAALATFLVTQQHKVPARLEIIPLRREQVVAYNVRHGLDIPWPPPLQEISNIKTRRKAA